MINKVNFSILAAFISKICDVEGLNSRVMQHHEIAPTLALFLLELKAADGSCDEETGNYMFNITKAILNILQLAGSKLGELSQITTMLLIDSLGENVNAESNITAVKLEALGLSCCWSDPTFFPLSSLSECNRLLLVDSIPKEMITSQYHTFNTDIVIQTKPY